jgi:hypothetical protein
MAEPIQEAGYNGRLVSLGGVVGGVGRGRRGERFTRALSAGVGQIGIPSNPGRIAATIQIFNGADDLQVYFGDSTDGPAYILAPRDMLQIDSNLPWIGAVYLYSAGAGVTVLCNEVSVQE